MWQDCHTLFSEGIFSSFRNFITALAPLNFCIGIFYWLYSLPVTETSQSMNYLKEGEQKDLSGYADCGPADGDFGFAGREDAEPH